MTAPLQRRYRPVSALRLGSVLGRRGRPGCGGGYGADADVRTQPLKQLGPDTVDLA
jgi:hypothetical protein